MKGRDPVACSLVDINGAVVTMLVRRGKLPDRVHTNCEVRTALSEWVLEEAEKDI